MIQKSWVLILIILFCEMSSASLGISPAVREYSFIPGQEIEIEYTVLSDNPEKQIDLYVLGDLNKSVTLSKYVSLGTESFTANIKMPQTIEKPGKNVISIVAKEVPPEDQFLGTAIEISTLIIINAPYPGKYAETELSIPNGNIDEQIPVEVKVINRGEEDLTTNIFVNFYSESKKFMEKMTFTPVEIAKGEEKYFRKFLDTSGYEPGDYLAQAIIQYDNLQTEVNKTFRVGSLFANITNFTTSLPKGGIQRFTVDVESEWNTQIDQVFAEINISREGEIIQIKTPPTSLPPWQKDTLTGFVDTTLMEGEYDLDVMIIYSGLFTTTSGKLSIIEPSNNTTMFIIIGAAILIVAVIIFIIIKLKKSKNKKVKK